MRVYTSELSQKIGEKVLLKGWVHDIRLLGGLAFLLLRDKEGIVQITAKKGEVDEKVFEVVKQLHQEDVVSIEGEVRKSDIARGGLEVIPSKIEIIAKSQTPLPLDPREVTKTNMDTKLNWRVLYFRTKEARAIFRIQSEIIKAFREYFISQGFIEMQPPVIIASASEGGAELFELPYFDKKVYLAQSPQLYKQMGAISFEKVFMICPVFRAEKFDQPTHLNEIRQMDFEQAFSTDEDAMKTLEGVFIHILKSVKQNCEKELRALGRELKIPKVPLRRVKYEEAIEALRKNGEEIEWGDDFSKLQERKLAQIFGNAFFIKDWPSELKPFYAMPHEEDPKLCKAFDLIHEGLEISSGTQRIHVPELLEKKITEKGLDPSDFKYYIDCFRYGAPPHAGASIGLERLTMTITGKRNIKDVTMFPRTRERVSP